MDFELTGQQKMLRNVVQDLAAKEIVPIAGALDRSNRFPWDRVERVGEFKERKG